jgi:hypothetical protein
LAQQPTLELFNIKNPMLPAHTFFTLFYPLLPFITQNFPQPNAKSNPKPKKQLEKSLSEKRDEVNFS